MANEKCQSLGSGSIIGRSLVLGILCGVVVSRFSTTSTNYRTFLGVKSAVIGCAAFLGCKAVKLLKK